MNSEEKQKVQLKRRVPVGFVLGVLLSVLLIGALIAGVVAGTHFGRTAFRENFGIDLFDAIDCIGDVLDDDDSVVTNPYSEEDEAAFYSSVNSALYLRDGAVNEEYIDGILEAAGLMSGGAAVETSSASESGEALADAVLKIFDADNFDVDRLGDYDSTSGKGINAVMTDRSLAAFFDGYLFKSGRIDDMTESLGASSALGDLKLSEVLSLDQVIVANGSELSEEDRTAYGLSESGVYLMLTMSMDVRTTVRELVANAGQSALAGIIAASLPAQVSVTAAADLADASAGIKVNINRMAQKPCEMRYLSEEMKAKYGADGVISEFDRLCIVVEAFTGVEIPAWLNASAEGVMTYICKGGDTPFCFADLIDLGSVAALEDGSHSFNVDAYGFVVRALGEALGSENLTTSDIIVLLQALICTDIDDALDLSERVDLYTRDYAAFELALEKCGMASAADIRTQSDINRLTAAGAAVFTADPGLEVPEDAVSIYSGMTEAAVFDAYEIEGAEDYTVDDIIAIVTGTALTEEQKALLEQLQSKLEGSAAEMPVFEINDKILGSMLRELADSLIVDLAELDVSVHSLTISKAGDRDYADITLSVSVADLTEAANNYFGELLPASAALCVRVEITPDAAQRGIAELVGFNGVGETGSVAPIEELTCARLLTAIDHAIPGFDFDGVLGGVSDKVDEVLGELSENFGEFVFVASDAA